MCLSHRILPVAVLLAIFAAAPAAQAAAGLIGHWEGKIQIPAHEMTFTVDLDQGSKGEWIGSLSIARSTTVGGPLIKNPASGTARQFLANLHGDTRFVCTL